MRQDWAQFGPEIRRLRKKRGLTLRALADAAGIDITYLSKIENGKSTPPSEPVITFMARRLGTDADELIRLAGKLPTDLERFAVSRPDIVRALRQMERVDVDPSYRIGLVTTTDDPRYRIDLAKPQRTSLLTMPWSAWEES